jgi:hypothetical protein
MKYELLPDDGRSLLRNEKKIDVNTIYRICLEHPNLIPFTEIK